MAQSLEVDEFIDTSGIHRVHILVAMFGTLVMFVDGFNIQVIGYIAPELTRSWHIPPQLLGPIFSSGLLGVFGGYLVLAPLSNRVGHRKMMIGCTAILGSLTLLTTLVHDAYTLMGVRFVTGLALGAANPSAVSIIADFCPARRRSTFVVVGICGVSTGSMFAGLTSAALLDRFGWESVLIVGGALPLALTVALIAALPDSLEYTVKSKGETSPATLALARRIDPDRSIPDDTHFVSKESVSGAITQVFLKGQLPGTLAVWLGFTVNLLVYYFVQSWLTTLIVRSGHTQQVAVTATALMAAGGTMSIFALGPLMDRFQPFKILALFFAAGAMSVAALGALLLAPVPVLQCACFMTGFFVLGVQKGMNAVTVFFYPTALRSTGLGWGLGIGRLGAVAGPVIAGLLMQGGQATASLFYFSALPMMIGSAAMIFMFAYYGDRRLRGLAVMS